MADEEKDLEKWTWGKDDVEWEKPRPAPAGTKPVIRPEDVELARRQLKEGR
jgi:hypothetical protein